MAIQQRRGADADFDANKMLSGELAVTTDGTRKVYAAFAPGDAKELASKEEVEKCIQNGIEEIEQKKDEALAELETNEANFIISKSTGEVITTTDSAKAKPKNIKLFGKGKQRQYEGNQLLDISSAVVDTNYTSIDSDGWITVDVDNSDGAGTLYTSLNLPVSDLIEAGKDYLAVLEIKENSTTDNHEIVSSWHEGPGQFKTPFILYQDQNSDSVYTQIVTAMDDFSDCETMTRTVFTTSAGNVTKLKIRLSIIEDTTVTPDTFVYEPYVGNEPSPSLNYPQEVESLGESGSIGGKVLTGNLFPYPYVDTSLSRNGLEFTDNGDGTIGIKGNATSYCWFSIGDMVLDVGTYTVSGRQNNIKLLVQNKNTQEYLQDTFTIKEKTTLGVWLDLTVGANIDTTLYPMLNVGAEALPYEPYTEQPFTFQTPNGLPGIPLGTTIPDAIKNSPIHMSGVYWDGEQYQIADTKNENGKDVHRILECGVGDFGEILIAGDSNWYDSEKSYSYELKHFKIDNVDATTIEPTTGLSTHFTGYSFNDFYMKGIENGFMNSQNYIVVNISKAYGICKTVDEFKQYCIDNGVKFYKILAEPIITDTDTQLDVTMNYPTTTIVNDEGAYMEVEYICDPKKHIEQNYTSNEKHNALESRVAELEKAMVNS